MQSHKAILTTLVCAGFVVFADFSEGADDIDAGAIIDQVISGTDFGGRELVISGIALTQTGDGTLLNLGTMATYKSGAYKNFVSVYDTTQRINKGTRVRVRVLVEESSASKLGEDYFVIIDTAFKECLSCSN